MDIHLSTLSATLGAISALHAESRAAALRPLPFTSAMLNLPSLDVLAYIRDADPLDAALFTYPALPAGGEEEKRGKRKDAAPGASGASASTAADDAASLLAPRLPEPRHFLPPTPLRKPAPERAPYDARTLLLAAQKLVDNYHNAPRARRHIKSLLRHSTELSKSAASYKRDIAAAEAEIARLSAPGASAAAPAAAGSSKAPSAAEKEEAKRLAKEMEREEMELIALEEMERELQERRKALSRPKKRPSPAVQPPPQQAREASSSEAAAPASSSEAPAASEGDETVAPASSSEAAGDAGASDAAASGAADEGDETLRLPSASDDASASASAAGAADEAASRLPEATDELERVSENIWSALGDVLRVLRPECEGLPFHETLALLQALIRGQGAAGPSVGDSSLGSTATGTTSSTAASSTAALPVLAPTPTTVHAAHLLVLLLCAPAPHQENMNAIKARAQAWWAEQGRQAWLSHGGAKEGTEEQGESLATKAMYQLVAQKILRVRHVGGGRVVSFA